MLASAFSVLALKILFVSWTLSLQVFTQRNPYLKFNLLYVGFDFFSIKTKKLFVSCNPILTSFYS